jgi:hypothetical protein
MQMTFLNNVRKVGRLVHSRTSFVIVLENSILDSSVIYLSTDRLRDTHTFLYKLIPERHFTLISPVLVYIFLLFNLYKLIQCNQAKTFV